MDTSARLAAITAEDGVDPALLECPPEPGLLRPGRAGGSPAGEASGFDISAFDGAAFEGTAFENTAFESPAFEGGDPAEPGDSAESPLDVGFEPVFYDPLPGFPLAEDEEETEPDAPAGATAVDEAAGGAAIPAARDRAATRPASAGRETPPDQQRLDAALAELDRMVGLEPVKRQVLALSAQLRMARLRAVQGLPVQPPKRHFVFSGPSGTGKTTVARILGRVFYALGLLSGDHLVEAQRADLVGEFLGQTAVKANELIDSALDGVLFIDEAYSLANSGYSKGDAYGDEALQVLLKRAEDNRDRLVVILAGYPEGMNRLLAANPGLSSRFTTRVDFPSYRPSELAAIGQALAAHDGDFWDDEALEELRSICAHVVREGWIDDLGNGRFMRTLYEKSCAYRDLRLSVLAELPTRQDLAALRLPDVLQAYGELIDGR
jgi:hypothetical protein